MILPFSRSAWYLIGSVLAAAFLAGCALQPLGATRTPITLDTRTVKIVGANARFAQMQKVSDPSATEDYLGYWTNTDTFLQWDVKNLRPGAYLVQVYYSLDPQFPGSTIAVSLAGQTFSKKLDATKNWDDYQSLEIGTIRIAAASDATLTLKATDKPKTYVLNLKHIALYPVGE